MYVTILLMSNLKPITLLSIPRYGDFTTQSGIGEGLYFKNGSLQDEKLKILSRTYAQVYLTIYLYVLI